MIWKRVGRVVDLVESPYSSSTKAPGFLDLHLVILVILVISIW